MQRPEYDKKIIELLEEVLERGNLFKLKAYGKSMYPFIEEGSIISIKKVSYNEIKTGDIILYNKAGNLFAHRVLYKSNNNLFTKGDNLTTIEKIRRNEVIGKVIRINEKEMNHILNYILTIYSVVYGVVIGVALKIKKVLFKEKKNRLTKLCGRILGNIFFLSEKVLLRIFKHNNFIRPNEDEKKQIC